MLRITAVAFAVIAVALGTFFVARALLPESAAETAAQPPAQTSPDVQTSPGVPSGSIVVDFDEVRRLLREDAQKPRFNGVVNGIRFYDHRIGPDPEGPCSSERAESQWVPIEQAQGAPLDVRPSYLPPEAREIEARASECNGVLAVVTRTYQGTSGVFTIKRTAGEHAAGIDAPADRIKPATIRGKNAALIEPVVPDVAAYPGVYVAEEFGLTSAGGDVPMEELIRVVEGLQ